LHRGLQRSFRHCPAVTYAHPDAHSDSVFRQRHCHSCNGLAALGEHASLHRRSNRRHQYGVTWSVNAIPAGTPVNGNITSAGVYTAPQNLPPLTTITITAQSVADPTKQASASITIASDISIGLAPSAVGVELGATQPFHAAIASGGQPNPGIRWSLSGASCPTACGAIDTNGNYTAPQILPAPATVTLTAQSVADPAKQTSAAVTITSNFSLQLAAPASVASGGSGAIAATLTPVAGSNPSTQLGWTLSGAGCSGAACGALAVVTTQALGGGTMSTSATYTAPVTPPSPNTVTITVTPQADPSKKAQVSVVIQPGVGVTLSPSTYTLAGNHRVTLTAQVFGSANSAVTWTVNGLTNGTGNVGQICVVGSNPCQPLSAGNNLLVDFQAPGTIPTPNPVTVRATSVADASRSATSQITLINHDVVTVLPSTVTLAPLVVQQFSATVLGANNQAVVWQIQGTALRTRRRVRRNRRKWHLHRTRLRSVSKYDHRRSHQRRRSAAIRLSECHHRHRRKYPCPASRQRLRRRRQRPYLAH
jgi:hypothetical protein